MLSVDKQIEDIIRREGGFNDIKEDRGGATNLGISLRYARSVGLDLDEDGDTDNDDIKLVTPEEAAKLYKRDFYFGPRIHKMPSKLRPQLFDISVNAGGARAIILLQEVINDLTSHSSNFISEDGAVGPKTIRAAEYAIKKHGYKLLNNSIVDARIGFYTRLAARRPSQKRFIKGWINRAEEFRR